MLQAAIWDMDGVLSDTAGLWAEVENLVLARYGIEISAAELGSTYNGLSYSQMLPILFGRFGITADVDTVAGEIHKTFDAQLVAKGIMPIDGAPALVNTLHQNGIKLAVASGSRLSVIQETVRQLGLADKFSALTSCYEVGRGKPDPAVFLLTAERIGITPKHCVVLEDSRAGMEGAKSAGMKCIGLVRPEELDKKWPADMLVSDLSHLSISQLRQLCGQ